MRGTVHLFQRSHINTDEIIPARYLNIHDEATLARHAMEDIDGDFVDKVKEGDFIVAGEDFGCGSSREHAVWALRGAGVRAVMADSFARIFYRNAISNGFYAIEIPGISRKVNSGDQLEIDMTGGKVTNITKDEVYTFPPFTSMIQAIVSAGGLLNYITRQQTGERISG
ncbi:MAG: 3-isopropylmalate dehydratase small subunit [Fidelibacterota bacterium]|nr:MAG: 3-isopropylmalate dehydratase small subunit [Candidatus Neomarinimicrobiota bacterium]